MKGNCERLHALRHVMNRHVHFAQMPVLATAEPSSTQELFVTGCWRNAFHLAYGVASTTLFFFTVRWANRPMGAP